MIARCAAFSIILLLTATPLLPQASGPPTLEEVLARDFRVTSLDGTVVPLNDLIALGKPVVVEFWATWCAPCRKTIPHLKDLYGRYGERDLVVVGFTIEKPEKDLERVDRFVRQMEMPYRVAFAPEEMFRFMNRRDSLGVPKILVYGADGKVITHITSYTPMTNRNVGSAVARAVRMSKR